MKQLAPQFLSTVFTVAVAFGSMALAQPPDNTQNNKQDRSPQSVTADKQSQAKGDLELARQIRREIVQDKDLSLYAHNAKVIVRAGVVTLRGPVKSEEEKQKLGAIAIAHAGEGRVNNQLEVTPPSGK